MNSFRLFTVDRCKNYLLDYPCVDSNNVVFFNSKICIFDNHDFINNDLFNQRNVFINPSSEEMSFVNIGIIAPIICDNDNEASYFEILNYYIKNLQLLIHKQKWMDGFKHIVVLLPYNSNKYSTSLNEMAYYSIYGLIKGLGQKYATYGIFVNGISLPQVVDNKEPLYRWIKLLSSNNSNNIVGQIVQL